MDAILILARTLNLEAPENYEAIASRFSDVGKNHKYAKEIAAVVENGIFLGNGEKMGINGQLTENRWLAS